MVPLVGFLPANDPMVLSTIEATEERGSQTSGDWSAAIARTTVSRARKGPSSSARSGWRKRWRRRAGTSGHAPCSNEAIAFVNDVGLLAEEVDSISGELFGNFPQAFSHIGLVDAAWAISQAEAGAPDGARAGVGSFAQDLFPPTLFFVPQLPSVEFLPGRFAVIAGDLAVGDELVV